jgi:branched-chain amino acid transport system permease protein
MNIKQGIRAGVITFGLILYLNLLGLPLTIGKSTVTVFSIIVGLTSIAFLRKREDSAKDGWRQTLLNGLVLGIIVGLGQVLITYIFAILHAQGIIVAEVFAQIKPEHTGALVGLTKEEIVNGVSVVPGLLKILAFFTLASLLGAIFTQLSTKRMTTQLREGSAEKIRNWSIFALPFIFYALFLALKIEGVNIGGTEENVVGLVLIYGFIGAALFALRAARPGVQKTIITVCIVVLILVLPLLGDLKQNAVLGAVAIFILMGIGLNIVVGFAGLLDLGYVAFFAVGAYTYGLLSAPASFVVLSIPGFEGINFWTGVPIAVLMGAFAGILLGIPVLRMRGDYLAIVTLGFGEIVRLVILNLRGFTGGPGGVLDIPAPEIFGHDLGNPRDILYLAMAFGVIVSFFAIRLHDSRLGRAWVALREDEDVAQAMGINLVAIKLLAFASGAAFAALSGTIYAARQVNIFPDNFALDVSINVLSIIIIGGIGSIDGVILGSIALIGLPEILRSVDEYRIVAFGALLVVMMIIRPEGLLPSARRKRELHAAEELAGKTSGDD